MKFKEKKSFTNIPQAEGMNTVATPPPLHSPFTERAPIWTLSNSTNKIANLRKRHGYKKGISFHKHLQG